MSDIKTKEKVKGVRALDKSKELGQRMKSGLVKTKQKMDDLTDDGQVTTEEYANDRMQEMAESAAEHTASGARTTVQHGKDACRHHREKVKAKQEAQAAPEYQRPMRERAGTQQQQRTVRKPGQPTQAQKQAEKASRKSIQTMEKSGKTIRQSAKSAGKQTARAGQRTVKTAEQSSKMAIKTAKQAEKAAQKAAKASAQAAKKSAQAAAKAAKSAGSAVAKTASAVVKTIAAGTAKLIAAIAAGGWVALLIILIIAVVAMIVMSCFGIFAGWDDRPELRQVVQEINADYNAQIQDIQNSHIYEELEMSGSRAAWPEVLSIYSIVATTDPDNPQDVATMTDEKEALLASIFWMMNEISYREEIHTVTVTIETDDGSGNIIETQEERTLTTLYITVSHKTALEMADRFGFNENQREQLAAMLDSGNNSMWASVLYGIHSGDSDIVMVASSQIGNVGGEPYWSWYGFERRVAWCHCFVSWCADQCGYLEAGIVPNTAGCVTGVNWFKERSQWADGSVEPVPGMIIYFDWDNKGDSGPQDGLSDHVGIVEKVEDGYVYTIEGNTSDSCAERWYPIGYYEILGYGVPAY